MKAKRKTKELTADTVLRWLLLLPLLFMVAGSVMSFWGVRQFMRAQVSTTWPTVTGVVTISDLGKQVGNERDETTTYNADISYDYVANDRSYVNGAITVASVNSSDPSAARRLLKRYPVGKQVTVYYNPADPQDAVLEPGFTDGSWFLPSFGALFVVVGIAVFFFLRWIGRALTLDN